jgi:tetratricopeptide (TPR) repeat protein
MSQKSLFPHHNIDWTIARIESKLQNLGGSDPGLRLELSRVLLSSGLFHKGGEGACAKALGQAKKVLQESGESVEALTLAGMSLLGMDRPESAERYLRKAESLDPNRADLQLALGSLSRALGREDEMLSFLERACQLSTDAWEPHLYLGTSLLRIGRRYGSMRFIERAQYHLVQAQNMDPMAERNPELLHDMGLACLLTGRLREAEKFFNRLRDEPKKEAVARFHLGLVAYRLGKHNNSINHFRQYLQHKPDDPGVLARMAQAWFQVGDYSRAREACRKALLVEPYHLMARRVLGRTLLKEGDDVEALRVFRETLREYPEHMPIYAEIIRTHRENGNEHWLEQALQVEVSNYDLQPMGGKIDARRLTWDRIRIILDEFRALRSTHALTILNAIDHTQDENLRFMLWEAACGMVESHVANETSSSLRSPGSSYSIRLGEAAASLGQVIPEHILTAGLDITEQDLQRAATDRYDPAHDVSQHRQNLDKERNNARGYQSLLLLSIASKESESGRALLQEWASNADDEMSKVARLGLAILGDAEAVRDLQRSARSREELDVFASFKRSIEPDPLLLPRRRLLQDGTSKCRSCGRSHEQVSHMLAGGGNVICDICISETWINRSKLPSPDEAICSICGRTHFESQGIYRTGEVDICSQCTQFSLGTREREAVERHFSGR